MAGLPELPDDPLPLAQHWLDDAARAALRNSTAMALATATPEGQPSVRMVLLKALSAVRGFGVFYSHRTSRKGRELDANPRAAGVLYWQSLGRQLRLEGRVTHSPDVESDAYFATRPFGSQVNAWASAQSAPIASFADLGRRTEERARQFAGASVPRPAHWGGYRLWFEAVEFWVEGTDRFHERVRYERRLDATHDIETTFIAGRWSRRLLQP